MIFSKFETIETTCKEYVHPWSDSCTFASLSLVLPCIKGSLRIYIAAYLLALLLRGKIPTKKDLKNTILGILQSCIFLTFHGFSYSATNCLLRAILGHYNFYTVSFLPSFLSSIAAILIERPSRRGLLSLYVTNVASETVFRMAVSRNYIKPIRYGEVLIFATAISYLLCFYREFGLPRDPVHTLIRFLVGPYEEYGFIKPDVPNLTTFPEIEKKKFNTWMQPIMNWYYQLVEKIKSFGSLNPVCPHYESCFYYSVAGGVDKFVKGYIVQLIIKVALNFKKIVKKPILFLDILRRFDTYSLGICFGTFTTLFRSISCILRRKLKKDNKYIALPAGFIAGFAFYFYRDNTIALYIVWKAFQFSYNLGVDFRYLPELPWAPVLFHAFSTAILFHVAIVEPINLRQSYWKFLQMMSGGRIADMDRICIDRFGLTSSTDLAEVLARNMGKK